jgi:hypothetical protein
VGEKNEKWSFSCTGATIFSTSNSTPSPNDKASYFVGKFGSFGTTVETLNSKQS